MLVAQYYFASEQYDSADQTIIEIHAGLNWSYTWPHEHTLVLLWFLPLY